MLNTTRQAILRRIGFMQGRLSPVIDGKIQAFPVGTWQEEFETASKIGFLLMEWTLDQHKLYENPLMNTAGRKQMLNSIKSYNVQIPSLTGDCFMQAPFYKATGNEQKQLLKDLRNIIYACSEVDIRSVLIPLVDNGRIENKQQEKELMKGMMAVQSLLKEKNVNIHFESDWPAQKLAAFIRPLDKQCFGITYDIGNSASLGYDPAEEIQAYGDRIHNVHVKDRVRGGKTVPLGQGDADIPATLRMLINVGYSGNFILQTARAEDGDHAGALRKYREMLIDWLEEGILTLVQS